MAATESAHICLDEKGTAWIEGTTTKVLEVVRNQAASGVTPEELQADMPHLTLPQVYSALSYYHAHQEEVDADIARREAYVEAMRAQATNQPSRAELLARLKRTR